MTPRVRRYRARVADWLRVQQVVASSRHIARRCPVSLSHQPPSTPSPTPSTLPRPHSYCPMCPQRRNSTTMCVQTSVGKRIQSANVCWERWAISGQHVISDIVRFNPVVLVRRFSQSSKAAELENTHTHTHTHARIHTYTHIHTHTHTYTHIHTHIHTHTHTYKRHHLPHGDTKGPHVRFEREPLGGQAFRRHVSNWQTTRFVQLPVDFPILKHSSLSEIAELDNIVLAQKYVPDCQVAVNDTFLQ